MPGTWFVFSGGNKPALPTTYNAFVPPPTTLLLLHLLFLPPHTFYLLQTHSLLNIYYIS